MLSVINRMRKDEDGQAMVIAAIGLLIMAIGVIATAQIGFAIFERQKLQTIADAQAYSLATMHARAFNFFAFTNRAMAAHYVAMMHMQGIISALTMMEASAGVLADLTYTAYGAGCCVPPDDALCWLLPIATGAEMSRIGLTQTINQLDRIFKTAIDSLFTINRTIYFTAQTTFALTLGLTNIFDQIFNQVLNKTDPSIDIGVSNIVTAAANTAILATIFDQDSMTLPNTNAVPGTNQAGEESIGTEVANATRVPANVLTDRSALAIMGGGINIDTSFFSGQKGQSRMLEFTSPEDFSLKLPNGNVMTSKDIITLTNNVLGKAPGTASIEVLVQNDFIRGKHKRYSRYYDTVYVPPVMCNPNVDRFKEPYTTDALGDNNHGGWQGIGPFMALNPANVQTPNKDFGQHGVVVWLNKKTERLSREGLEMKFTLHAPTYQTGLDTSIGRASTLTSNNFRGLNSIATAQVYYHRPGNWREVPNLFNPFWKARLYPVAQWLNKWVIGGTAGNMLPPEIVQLLQGYLIIH